MPNLRTNNKARFYTSHTIGGLASVIATWQVEEHIHGAIKIYICDLCKAPNEH